MADQTPPNPPSTSSQSQTPGEQPPARKKGKLGRRILIAAGVLVVLLVLLVVMIPTIAGMGFVRNIVVGKINDNLNGKVAIDDWRLTWSGGVDVSGISVLDPGGAKVIELRKMHTDLSLFDAIKGRYDLGKVNVDGLRVNLVMNADGTNNLQTIAKPSSASSSPSSGKDNGQGGGISNVTADVHITDGQATVSGAGVPQTIAAAFGGTVSIPDINQTITNSLNTTLTIGSTPAGKIDLSGGAQVFKNGAFDEKGASVSQKLNIAGLQLAGVAPFVPKTSVTALQGVTDGQIAVDLKGGSAGTVQGGIVTKNVTVTGPALNGDTFRSDGVAVEIPATAIDMANGLADVSVYHVRTSAPIAVSLGKGPGGADLGGAQVTVAAAVQGLSNMAAGKAPGSDGKVEISDNLDLAALSAMLPRTLKLVEGVRIQSGKLGQKTSVVLSEHNGMVQTTTDLSAVTAVDTKHGNKQVTIRPIHLDASATAGGGGATDFRNLALNLTSGFATASFKGQTLADLAGQAKGDLKAMHDEIGQVVDFGGTDLAGTFDMTLASSGNLAQEKGQGKVETRVTLQNLRVAGLADGKSIDQKWMNIAASAQLVRGAEKFLDAIDNAVVTVKTGDPNNPTIDLASAANVNLAGKTPTVGFALQRLFVDAARAQQEFSALMPGDYKVTSGTLTATAQGTWSGGKLELQSFNAKPENLSVNLQAKDGKSTTVVNAMTMNVETAGTVVTGAEQNAIDLTKLNVAEAQRRLVVQKISDGPLAVTVGKNGFAGNGKLQVAADLAFVNSVVQAVSAGGQQVVAQAKSGEVKSGMLDGTLGFDSATNKPTTVAGDFKIANLVVTDASGGTTRPEEIGLALQAVAPADFSSVTARNVAVKSRFANVNVTDSLVQLKSANGAPVGTFDMVQKANVAMDVTDVGALYSIAGAFMPAAPAPQPAPTVQQRVRNAVERTGPVGSQVISRAADEAGHPIPQATTAEQLVGPLTVQGGRASAKLTVARDNGATTVNLTDLSGGDIQLKRGSKSYTVQPFDVKLTASVRNAGDQIQQIDVTQLAGKLGIADLSMEQPISIKNPGGDEMAASGAVRLAGELQKASDLLQVVNGQPVPYTGAYTLVQKLNTSGNTVGLSGNADLTNFQVLDETGKPSLSEEKVAVVNDLKIDQKSKNIAGALSVDSKAVGVKFNGGVNQFDTGRQIVDGTTLALSYDAAKAWQIVKPMLSPETQASLADMKVAGVKQTTLKLAGAFPADQTFQRAITSLTASGALPLDSLQVNGIDAKQVNPGFTLAGGKLTVVAGPNAQPAPAAPPVPPAAGAPAPKGASAAATPAPAHQLMRPTVVTAIVNGGTVDLTNLVVDLTTPEPTLTAPANKGLAHNVALNAILAKYANQVVPIFDVTNQSAVADVTLVRCDRLPLGSTMTKPNNGGYAEVQIALANVKPGGPVVGGIDQFVGNFLGTSAQLTVQPTTIVLAEGQAKVNNFALAVGQGQRQVLKLDGTVSLAENGALSLTANIPSDMIKRFGKDVLKYLPNGVDLPIGGTKERPEFAGADKVVASMLKQAAVSAAAGALTGGNKKDGKQGGGGLGDVLGNVLGGGNQQQQQQAAPAQNNASQQQQQQATPAGQQTEPSAADAIGGLINALSKDKDKDKKASDTPAAKPDQQKQPPAKKPQQQQQKKK